MSGPYRTAYMSYYCEDGHERVEFDTQSCPMCELIVELQDLKSTSEQLTDEKQDLQDTLDNYDKDFVQWKEVKDRLNGE